MNALDFAEKRRINLIIPLIKEANKNNVHVDIISKKHKILKFSFNDSFFYTYSDALPFVRRYPLILPKNKDATKKMLQEYSVITPNGIRALSFESAKRRIIRQKLSFPLILKPIDGRRAIGVFWNINSMRQLQMAIRELKNIRLKQKILRSKTFIVEEQFIGEEFRVLVLNNKAIACAKKIPASVTGDGTLTIQQLIDQFNTHRERSFYIKLDTVVHNKLKERGLSLSTILEKNTVLQLRDDMMLANGGRAIDHSKMISPALEDICVRSAHAVGLSYAGIDILIKRGDHAKKIIPEQYKVIEVNAFPGHILNEHPLVENPTVNVSKLLLQHFLPIK